MFSSLNVLRSARGRLAPRLLGCALVAAGVSIGVMLGSSGGRVSAEVKTLPCVQLGCPSPCTSGRLNSVEWVPLAVTVCGLEQRLPPSVCAGGPPARCAQLYSYFAPGCLPQLGGPVVPHQFENEPKAMGAGNTPC